MYFHYFAIQLLPPPPFTFSDGRKLSGSSDVPAANHKGVFFLSQYVLAYAFLQLLPDKESNVQIGCTTVAMTVL